jgi:hypothetical protein
MEVIVQLYAPAALQQERLTSEALNNTLPQTHSNEHTTVQLPALLNVLALAKPSHRLYAAADTTRYG